MSKKQTIRITESDLIGLVKNIINETDFKQVDNLIDYISQNNLQMKPASKFQRVNVQSGKSYINQYGRERGLGKRQIGRMVRRGGAPLTTIASDRTQETNNMVTRNHTVLNNVGNTKNRWAAETPTFKRKYELDPMNKGTYKPNGGPMNAAQINEPISFIAPFGKRMDIDKGGYILQDPNDPNDVYGISGEDFDKTYRFDEAKRLKRAIRLNEYDLNRFVLESVKNVLRETEDGIEYDEHGQAIYEVPEVYKGFSNYVDDAISVANHTAKTPEEWYRMMEEAMETLRLMATNAQYDHPQTMFLGKGCSVNSSAYPNGNSHLALDKARDRFYDGF